MDGPKKKQSPLDKGSIRSVSRFLTITITVATDTIDNGNWNTQKNWYGTRKKPLGLCRVWRNIVSMLGRSWYWAICNFLSKIAPVELSGFQIANFVGELWWWWQIGSHVSPRFPRFSDLMRVFANGVIINGGEADLPGRQVIDEDRRETVELCVLFYISENRLEVNNWFQVLAPLPDLNNSKVRPIVMVAFRWMISRRLDIVSNHPEKFSIPY